MLPSASEWREQLKTMRKMANRQYPILPFKFGGLHLPQANSMIQAMKLMTETGHGPLWRALTVKGSLIRM